MPDSVAKPCVICGRDCTGQPRIKDAQGRYSHQACLQKRQAAQGKPSPADPAKPPPAAKPKPRTPAAPAGGVMIDLVDEALQSAPVLCENCGKSRPKNAVLCTHCGFNAESGKALRTRVEKPKKEKVDKAPRGGPLINGKLIMTVGLLPMLATAGLTFVHPAWFFAFYAVAGLINTIAWILAIFDPLRDRSVGWCVVNALAPFHMYLLTLYYVFTRSSSEVLRALWTLVVLSVVLTVPLVFVVAPMLAEESESPPAPSPRATSPSPDRDTQSPASEVAFGTDDATTEPEQEPTPTGWARGALSAVLGAPPTPDFTPTATALRNTREGEPAEMVERALWQGAYWTLRASTDPDTAYDTLLTTASIEDFDPETTQRAEAAFGSLTDEQRRALLRYVETGGVLRGAAEIEAAFAD